ncbi:MAG: methyltransferase domain-containing protein [Methanomicrobiaceae archaeon]|nr:methyltransferase domain-containing protein [Methanomicrobiaceae archaeon]
MMKKNIYNEKDLAENIYNAMKRIEKLGITYPDDYYEKLCERYSLTNVPYPFIVRHVGNPRIVKHFLYRDILKSGGIFLDYGCGTGDAIRQLIREGYPREKIHGFDVNEESIILGADLYLDHDEIESLVSVSPVFESGRLKYDIVYSGSVIHVIKDEDEFRTYLTNAYNSLKNGGIFFGSTLGLNDFQTKRERRGPPRLMHKEKLEYSLSHTGFKEIKIINEKRTEIERPEFNLSLFQFSARK